MKPFSIRPLNNNAQDLTAAIDLLTRNCSSESGRYDQNRLSAEIVPIDSPTFYKKFYGAYDLEQQLIGVGGIKAADWASDTHILYMMAVEKAHRGQGVGSALEKIRIQWLRDNFKHGRCLVSTKHQKRFERWHFIAISEINQRQLMLLEF